MVKQVEHDRYLSVCWSKEGKTVDVLCLLFAKDANSWLTTSCGGIYATDGFVPTTLLSRGC